jgi:hypothetical protein
VPSEIPAAENALHLALFVAAAVALAAVVLAVLERLLERGENHRPTIRFWHVAIPIAVFAAIGIAERLYHLLS